MAVPIIYGLYLLAGVAGRAGAKYGIKKVVKNATGRLLSRHKTRELANTAKKKVTKTNKPQETSRPPPLGDTKAAGQTLAGARYQSAAGAGSRQANPTAAARPQVRAGGGGAGGRPLSRVAVGAGLGLVGGGIGAAALVAKKRAEQKEKAKAKAKNKAKPKFDPEGIKERLASRKSGKLKTSLRAARAAGDLYYKNLKTGKKMVAVLESDLKPGQSLTQYVNKKENKTPRTPIPRRKPTPPKSTRG